MSDELVFMMGEYRARFPTDRQYAKNHMWARAVDSGGYRVGFSNYAIRLLQDVYFLDWCVDEGVELAERQEIGAIESKKAESDLFAPIGGRLIQFNESLMQDPAMINVDGNGKGWLFEIEGSGEALLEPEAYLSHLESVWEVTQRTIKGQLNE